MIAETVEQAVIAGVPLPNQLLLRPRSPGASAPTTDSPASSSRASQGQSPALRLVFSRIREALLTITGKGGIEGGISSLLRDQPFTEAWKNANQEILSTIQKEELLSPVVEESLRGVVGGYRDELQRTAAACVEVFEAILAKGSLRPGIGITSAQLMLPTYLDDDALPVEVLEALLSRDTAWMTYLALNVGAQESALPELLAEYAEMHCKHQRRWLDLLAWLFDVPTPAIVGEDERQDWPRAFSEWRDMKAELAFLVDLGKQNHPDGFALGGATTD